MQTRSTTLAGLLLLVATLAARAEEPVRIDVRFSPDGGCAAAIVAALDAATTSIDVALYQFTAPTLIDAVHRAAARGVAVRLLLDRTNETGTAAALRPLANNPARCRVPTNCKLFHHKFAIIDGRYTITGSYNWSANAETRNAENLVAIDHQPTAAAFTANFDSYWQSARAFHQKPRPISPPKKRPPFLSTTAPAHTLQGAIQWH